MRLTKKGGIKMVKEVLNMGINFIDTANAYGDSEEKIGESIKDFSREDLVISSKSEARGKKNFLENINLSLKRLSTDYIDIYHLHGVNSKEILGEVMDSDGAYFGLLNAIEMGKVRYAAFSSHSIPLAIEILKSGKFQITQIPINFVDTEAEEELIPLSQKLNIGFIAMKPMGGGLLNDANLAFRYLAQFKGIIPDPGIEKIEEMEEIIKIINNPRSLTDSEKKKIKRIRSELGNEWCHRCEYCMPCPQNIPISTVLEVKSMVKRIPLSEIIQFMDEAMEKVNNCTECEECIPKCPYNLKIPKLLKKNQAFWYKYKSENL
jgi:uncharacterized protein